MGNVLTSKGFQLTPNVGQALQTGLGLRQQFEQGKAARQQLGRQDQSRELSGQLLGPQRLSHDEENQQLAQLFTTDPNAGLAVQKQLGLDTASKKRQAADFAFKAEGLPIEQQDTLINQRAQNILNRGGDPSDTLSLLQLGPEDRSRALRTIQLLDLSNEQRLKVAQGGSLARETAGQREFNDLLRIAQDPKSTELEKNSARRKLGDLAKVSTTASERIAEDEDLSKKVAESQAKIIGAKEEAKLGAQLKFKPQINKAVKLAEKEAVERGEVLTDLARMKAAKPGLDQAVTNLRELSSIATSTIAGKLFDISSKELGFGSTKGANARAKFIAIIDNQVLPLLKPTFGSAFTESEGKALRATLGDPDASPSEKMAQLDAFIEQKVRDIETAEAQLNPPQDINTLSDDDLLSF